MGVEAAHHEPIGAVAAAVVDLADPSAVEEEVVGAKAANLALAARAGLATLPGVVLTTAFCSDLDGARDLRAQPALQEVFAAAGGPTHRLVARSSSVAEDSSESSMAGQFESVVGIDGFEAFVAAVDEVLASRERTGTGDQPIAVLVQPLIEPRCAGVLFGVDPVTGRSDRRLISAVEGGPSDLVSGTVDGSRYLVGEGAEVIEHARNDGAVLAADDIARLVTLADDAARVFGGPQDVEWAITDDGNLWLLQSRPVTTEVLGVPLGPVYGPGPVAETFPEPLTELEADLWVPPLRSAVRDVVLLTGTATEPEVAASEVLVVVRGHVAIDLRLAGDLAPSPRPRRLVRPSTAIRRARGAWRLGRLRAALPRLVEDVLDRVDRDLEEVPSLNHLTSRQLFAVIRRTSDALHAVHAHEMLMGMLTDTGENRMTGASLALRILVEARRDGVPESEILERSPVVLALTSPRIGPEVVLPPDPTVIDFGEDTPMDSRNGVLREALRLRVRWLQELSGRAAWVLGVRLAAKGDLSDPERIRHFTLDQLEAVATKRAAVLDAQMAGHEHDPGEPLPAWFRLSDRRLPIRVQRANEVGGGTGGGGGIGTGPVTYDAEHPARGSVLVTTTLTPGLGPVLGGLAGLVSETGSVLSHLAILAREAGVATVVGYAGARSDLAEGSLVTVDGLTGQVTPVRPPDEGVNP